MKILRNIFSQLHVYVLWLLLSTMFWGWIFASFVNDTSPEKKVTIYVDAPAVADTALDAALEPYLPKGLRMVRSHPFSYAVFDTAALMGADIYIVPASRAEEYRGSFLPLGDAFPSVPGERWEWDGRAFGLQVYDAGTGQGAGQTYITYALPDQAAEDYYLFIGEGSLHAAGLTGRGDNAALEICEAFLQLD